jgi:hypothetical protein
MPSRLRGKLTFANVVSCMALFFALGGFAVAATRLAKNSVGTKQIKNNSITAAKIKDGAITGTKIQTDSLTGIQINASTLGTVPRAQVANSIAAPETWHEVGKPGAPGFLGEWENGALPQLESVAFYRDLQGVVHLRGLAINMGDTQSEPIFRLPAGYRPANGKELRFAVTCYCNTNSGPSFTGPLAIFGTGTAIYGGGEGDVIAPGNDVSLDGVTFRAES